MGLGAPWTFLPGCLLCSCILGVMMPGDLLVLVHGLAGTAAKHFRYLASAIDDDESFDRDICVKTFEYGSAKTAIFPWQDDPDLQTVATLFASFLETNSLEHERIILVAYSAGGLVARRALLALSAYAAARVSKLIYIACPLEGSDLGNAASWLNIGSKLARELSIGSSVLEKLKEDWHNSPFSLISAKYMWGTRDKIARILPGVDHENCYFTNHGHKDIKFFDVNGDHYKVLRDWVLGARTNGFVIPGDALSPLLTPTFSAELAKLKQTVASMSQEQFALFQRLAQKPRLVVEGGAGSGKTVLACEKAIRLGAAGMHVGLFCHNSLLARRLRQFTEGQPNVKVYDFNGYMQNILDRRYDYRTQWEIYESPNDEQIYAATDILLNGNWPEDLKFDAVVVDEGQDFDKDCLDILEFSLRSPNGIFYIFADQHQRTKDGSLFSTAVDTLHLTTNWRNSEKVFSIVKQFTPRATTSEQALAGTGDVVIMPTSQGEALASVRSGIAYVLDKVAGGSVVVLTNERHSLDESLAANMIVHRYRKPSWQLGLYEFLTRTFDLTREQVSRTSYHPQHGFAALSQIAMPTLSSNAYPTNGDFEAVKAFSGSLSYFVAAVPHIPCRVLWRVIGDKFVPEITGPRGKKLKRDEIELGHYFYALSNLTSQELRLSEPPSVHVRPYYALKRQDEVPLYNIQHFKGCEADGVVLFVRGPQDSLERHMYIGLSRARFCLYVVCDQEALASLHQFYQRGLPKLHSDISHGISTVRNQTH